MSGYNKLVWVALLLFSFGAVLAKDPPKDAQKDAQQLKELRKRPSYRSDCQQATRSDGYVDQQRSCPFDDRGGRMVGLKRW
jgi:hypothetical protein